GKDHLEGRQGVPALQAGDLRRVASVLHGRADAHRRDGPRREVPPEVRCQDGTGQCCRQTGVRGEGPQEVVLEDATKKEAAAAASFSWCFRTGVHELRSPPLARTRVGCGGGASSALASLVAPGRLCRRRPAWP